MTMASSLNQDLELAPGVHWEPVFKTEEEEKKYRQEMDRLAEELYMKGQREGPRSIRLQPWPRGFRPIRY